MKGGIFINKPVDEAFFQFITNSRIQQFSGGTNAITFTSELKQEMIEKSPYNYLRNYKYEKPVTKILIKIAEVFPDNEEIDGEGMHDSKFFDEVNTQTTIFLSTFKYLEPICPAPLFSEIMTSDDGDESLNKFLDILSNEDVMGYGVQDIVSYYKKPGKRAGIFAMEFAEDFV
jgi:hypothetical protein